MYSLLPLKRAPQSAQVEGTQPVFAYSCGTAPITYIEGRRGKSRSPSLFRFLSPLTAGGLFLHAAKGMSLTDG